MSKSKKDVYNAFLLEGATYKGLYEFPQILPTYDTPNKLIKFSKAVSSKCKDYNQWVHFYEEDYEFFRLWRNPKRYLKRLKRFNGVILPDFILYGTFPTELLEKYKGRGVRIIVFESEYATTHKEVV